MKMTGFVILNLFQNLVFNQILDPETSSGWQMRNISY